MCRCESRIRSVFGCGGGQSGGAGGVHGSRDFLHELVEFVAGKVAYRPEVETFFRPVADIIALDRLVYRTAMAWPPGAAPRTD